MVVTATKRRAMITAMQKVAEGKKRRLGGGEKFMRRDLWSQERLGKEICVWQSYPMIVLHSRVVWDPPDWPGRELATCSNVWESPLNDEG